MMHTTYTLIAISSFFLGIDCQTYVDDSSACSTCDGSELNPYKTLQEGLNNIQSSKLHIKAGTYTGPGNVNLTVQNSFTNVYGDGSDQTIIDCENEGHFQGWHLESGTFTIEGLTIRNCKAIQRSINYNGVPYGGVWGGGLWIVSTSTNIRDILIEGGEADSGGAIAIFSDSVFIYNSTIRKNKAKDGGGIFIQKAYLKLENVSIGDNEVSGDGGGIYGINGGTTEIFGTSLIIDNSADGNGDQIACINGSTFILKDETAEIDGEVHCDGCSIGRDGDNYCQSHHNGIAAYYSSGYVMGAILSFLLSFVFIN